MFKHQIVNHYYDVIVVGAGGSGLRATLGMVEKGLKTACVTKVFPTRSHTVAAQGGISAALGNMGEDDWRWHMYDTVKGSDWLGDQDAIEYMCRNAKDAVLELEEYGVPFSRTDDGRIYQRPFGGMTTAYGEGKPAQRTCAAADRTGHAILHTLYQQCLKFQAEFFIEYFTIDLILDEHGACKGVTAYCLEDGSFHRFIGQIVVLATGGYGRVYSSATSAYTCTGDGNGMVLRAGLQLQDMEFVQFHPTGIYGAGCLITEGVRGEGGYLVNSDGDKFMERYAPHVKDLASRDVVSRAIVMELREGRGCGPKKDYVNLVLSHLSPQVIRDRLPGIAETAHIFAGVDVTKEPIPVQPTVHYNMGGIPTNVHGEVVQNIDGKLKVVPGLMAIGEAACVSVHGANRLGSNSLLDLIVFGRAAAMRAADIVKAGQKIKAKEEDGANSFARIDGLFHSSKDFNVATAREYMQEIMQDYAGVFRDDITLRKGLEKLLENYVMCEDIGLNDKSRVWNTNLVEVLEMDNLKVQAIATVASALNRTESRGSHAREDYPNRDDVNWLKHSMVSVANDGGVEICYRPVNLQPMTSDVDSIPPKKRIY